jgi:hypothetical protein
MRRAPSVGLWVVALLLAVPALAPARAQGFGDTSLRATISQRVEANTNYRLDPDSAGTSYFGDTRLGFDLLRETSTQAFRLGFDTGLRALWEAGEDFEFTFASPSTANVGYNQVWSDGSFGADLRYRQRNVDFIDDLIFDFEDGEILVPDDLEQLSRDTIEQRYDADLSLVLREDAPSSYRFALEATQFDYRDDAENLRPRSTTYGEAEWLLRLNPVLSGSLLGSYYYFDTEAGTESTVNEAEIDVGLVYEPSTELSTRLGIGYADRTREETIDGERLTTEDNTGVTLRGGLNYTAADDLIIIADARLTTAAPSTRLSGSLRANYTLPRGSLTASLAQRYTDDTEGEEVRITTAGIGLTHTINSLSSLGFNFAYGLQMNEDDPEADDISRTDFSATYSRNLTAVVFANIGYRFRWRDQEDSATSNAVFFTLGRSFETRF